MAHNHHCSQCAKEYVHTHRRPDAGNAEASELTWGAMHSSAAADALAAKRLDLVVAADACYDDQVACSCCALVQNCPRLACWTQT